MLKLCEYHKQANKEYGIVNKHILIITINVGMLNKKQICSGEDIIYRLYSTTITIKYNYQLIVIS